MRPTGEKARKWGGVLGGGSRGRQQLRPVGGACQRSSGQGGWAVAGWQLAPLPSFAPLEGARPGGAGTHKSAQPRARQVGVGSLWTATRACLLDTHAWLPFQPFLLLCPHLLRHSARSACPPRRSTSDLPYKILNALHRVMLVIDQMASK